MGIKKPLICQAGSAEAFLDSAATGREQLHGSYYIRIVKPNLKIYVFAHWCSSLLAINANRIRIIQG